MARYQVPATLPASPAVLQVPITPIQIRQGSAPKYALGIIRGRDNQCLHINKASAAPRAGSDQELPPPCSPRHMDAGCWMSARAAGYQQDGRFGASPDPRGYVPPRPSSRLPTGRADAKPLVIRDPQRASPEADAARGMASIAPK
jgi:hypothetical protein